MPQKVIESLDASVEGGGVDILVEVIEDGVSPYANVTTTAEESDLNLGVKDVQKLRDLFDRTYRAMAVAAPDIERPFFDAIRLLMVTHYDGEAMIEKIEEQDWEFDCTDLFDRDMLKSVEIADTGEYEAALTLKGRIAIEQAFTRTRKAGA